MTFIQGETYTERTDRLARDRLTARWARSRKTLERAAARRPTAAQARRRKAAAEAERERQARMALAEQVRQQQAQRLQERVAHQPATMVAIDQERLLARARALQARATKAV